MPKIVEANFSARNLSPSDCIFSSPSRSIQVSVATRCAPNLAFALIEALGDLGYLPAVGELFKLRGTDYDGAATRALSEIAPERLAAELLATAKDTKADSYFRERALVTLCSLSMTNRVRDLVPLLDDVSPIVCAGPMPGPEWRVCDRAAVSIAIMLGWENPTTLRYLRPEEREEFMKRAREWANSVRGIR